MFEILEKSEKYPYYFLLIINNIPYFATTDGYTISGIRLQNTIISPNVVNTIKIIDNLEPFEMVGNTHNMIYSISNGFIENQIFGISVPLTSVKSLIYDPALLMSCIIESWTCEYNPEGELIPVSAMSTILKFYNFFRSLPNIKTTKNGSVCVTPENREYFIITMKAV